MDVNPIRAVHYLQPYHYDIICTLIFQEIEMNEEAIGMGGALPERVPREWDQATQYLVDVSTLKVLLGIDLSEVSLER
jgi:hypothetical protein